MSSRLTALLLIATVAGLAVMRPASVRAAGLTEGTRLSAIYDDILDARFDRARAQLTTACPPAPREACLALGVAITWWQIVLDLDNRSLDHQLETDTEAAVTAADAWTRREPQRAEAWFYLAASSAPLVQLRVFRGQRLAAAREGNRIRASLEKARALDPTLHDARFGIGLYHYYADVAPAAARFLRVLLLLPGGDRRQGLREMLEARDRGQLLRGEADYQLHWLYLWYEDQPQRALDLVSGLNRRFPGNPVFLQRIAEVQDDYFHDHPASAAAWTTLLTRARAGEVAAPALAEVRARLGLAIQLDAIDETDRAVEQLQAIVERQPAAPPLLRARAQLLLGNAWDRLGDRVRATVAYNAALAVTSVGDSGDIRSRARAGLQQRPEATRAQAYRQSLDGWRALERGDRARAVALLTQAHTRSPRDTTISYRYAHALLVHDDVAVAQRELERLLHTNERVLPVILASACVDLAVIYERANDRSRAIATYERARSIVGSDPRTRATADEALKRLVR